MKRFAAALLVALASLGPTSAASAATPDPAAAILNYSGTGVATDLNDGTTATYPVDYTIDCTGTPCTITGALSDPQTNENFPLTGGAPQPFTDARGEYSYQATGSACDLNYLGAYSTTIVASGNQLTATIDIADGGTVDCPDSTVQYDASHVDITTTLTSGDTCYVFATCSTPSATPVAVGGASSPPPAPIVIGTDATSPSTLSTLPTVATAITPANVAWAVAMTTVLAILIALPSHLINTALEHGSDRLAQWWGRRRPAPKPTLTEPKPGVSWSGWPLAAGGVLLASLVSSFVNPAFGFNASSARVFLSILASFLLDAVAGWFVVIWLVRRTAPTASAGFRFVPATLVIVAAAVLFSRLTGFQPGIIFGLVAGVVFGAALATAEKAKVALVPLVYSFGVAVIGWVGYSITVSVGGTHPGAALLFSRETLSAIAIAGIAALPIALIPLRGLAGYEVFSWNRWIWGASYAVGLFGFFFVLMPIPFSWTSVSLSIWVWAAIYVAYALFAVGIWLLVVRPWRRAAAEDAEREPTTIG